MSERVMEPCARCGFEGCYDVCPWCGLTLQESSAAWAAARVDGLPVEMAVEAEGEPLKWATLEDARLAVRDRALTGNAFVRVDDVGLAHRIDPEVVLRG